MDDIRYRVIIEQDEDGVFVAEIASLPGCITQGATREEALRNVREAIELYVQSLDEHEDSVPPPITEEIVEVQLVGLPIVSGRELIKALKECRLCGGYMALVENSVYK